MTCMRARTSSNFGLLGPLAAELAALERLKNPHKLIIPPVYEVYRGYIVFAFSVLMFVCLSVCKLFFHQRFLSNYLT